MSQNNSDFLPNNMAMRANLTQPFILPRSVESKPAEMARHEVWAIASIIEELGTRIFEELAVSHTGSYFSIHVTPKFDNLGSVARIYVTRKEKLEDASLHTENGGYQLALDPTIFKKEVLGPAVQRGRNGSAPQQIPLRVSFDDQLVCGVMTLYVGIRKKRSLDGSSASTNESANRRTATFNLP